MTEVVRDLRAINVLAKFENDPWKFSDMRALTVIFHVRSWKMRKKFPQNFFLRLWQNPEPILISMFKPTYVPYLVTLAWKMNSGRSKEAGSLNGRLCTYLMSQNLHETLGQVCQVWNNPWKFVDVRVSALPPARLPAPSGDDNTPEPLRAAG